MSAKNLTIGWIKYVQMLGWHRSDEVNPESITGRLAPCFPGPEHVIETKRCAASDARRTQCFSLPVEAEFGEFGAQLFQVPDQQMMVCADGGKEPPIGAECGSDQEMKPCRE